MRFLIGTIVISFIGFSVLRALTRSESPNFKQPQETFKGQTEDEIVKESSAPQVGSSAPNFTVENLEGEAVSLSDFADQNVLLVFWASTCGWCEKEKPDLIRFTKEQKGKIEVLAISNERKDKLRRYKEDNQINFTLLSDPSMKTQTSYSSFGTPAHFLINKHGIIKAARPGYASYADLMMLPEILEAE